MSYKDEALEEIAFGGGNIARFSSFAPDKTLRYSRISDAEQYPNTPGEAAKLLFFHGVPSINIRTFKPDKMEGNPFEYGLTDPAEIQKKVNEYASQGFYSIVHETIDVNDGGFSGVLIGNYAEFSSRDTPRCVEKEGCALLPLQLAKDLAMTAYGANLSYIPYPSNQYRIEFSVHPHGVGYRKERVIIWQLEKRDTKQFSIPPSPVWPNNYSRDMGDKAFGLLMAHLLGCRVPYTRVVGRLIPYFEFGIPTSRSKRSIWTRTCPRQKEPGKFTTTHEWTDPFELMRKEDPTGDKISSLIFQDDVNAEFSGAALTDKNGCLYIEGVRGSGEEFMVGRQKPAEIPPEIKEKIESVWRHLTNYLGAVNFEWSYSNGQIWILQLHTGASESAEKIIYPGDPDALFVEFHISQGLEKLRELSEEARREGYGILLKGEVGITSHFGDILRRNRIPSRLLP